MTTIYKYRVYCNSDTRYETAWGETEPLTCPVNTNHTIDRSKTVIIDTITQSIVQIKDEDIATGGNYQCATILLEAPPHTTTTKDVSWPYPVSVFSITFNTSPDHEGTILNSIAAPDATIGAIVAPLPANCNTVYASSTVFNYISIGFHMKVTDGINSDDLGEVLAIDKVHNKITTMYKTTHNYSPLSPTYVQMTVYRIKDFIFGPAGKYTVGKVRLVGAPIPANIIIRTMYENNTDKYLKLMAQVQIAY